MSRVAVLAQELVRFNTVNPPGDEEAAMRRLGGYLKAHGVTVEFQRLGPQRVNLVARIRGRGKGHLVLCGHMDVVHPGEGDWDRGPFDAEIVDGKLIGRGAADMKGGVAAMAQAMTELAASSFGPSADLILAVTAGEEVDMAGAKLMAASGILEGTAGVVIGEPTGLDVFRAEKGVLWLRLTAYGKTAHGSMPQLGVNAISYVTRALSRLEEHEFQFAESDVLGRPTVSVNVIHGGVKTNVVPDRCSAEIDLRLVPGQTRDDVLREIQSVLDTVTAEIPGRTEIEIIQDVPPVETAEDDALVAATIEVATEVRGEPPQVGGVSYGTDGARIAPSLDASLVICGPGRTDQLHQTNEYVELWQLDQAVEIYKGVARRFLAAES